MPEQATSKTAATGTRALHLQRWDGAHLFAAIEVDVEQLACVHVLSTWSSFLVQYNCSE